MKSITRRFLPFGGQIVTIGLDVYKYVKSSSFNRLASGVGERIIDAVGGLRIWFKNHYDLPITDPRLINATDDDIILDRAIYLMVEDERRIDRNDMDAESFADMAAVENGEMTFEEWEKKELESVNLSGLS